MKWSDDVDCAAERERLRKKLCRRRLPRPSRAGTACGSGRPHAGKSNACPCRHAVFDLKTEPLYVAPNAPKEKLGVETYPIGENERWIEVGV